MSDENNNQETFTPENTVDAQALPAIRVLAQYIKDLSFENPNAPASLRDTTQPKIDLQLDVNARKTEDADVFEVDLKINAKSEGDKGQNLFIVELVYTGLFQFSNVGQESLEPILLIECPRILFPFARHIIADATRSGGYPPLMVDPMDFAALYFSQRQAGETPQA
jgi:preprotein translocase subunit SecB